MSNLFIDSIIIILLMVTIGFGGIGVIGLFLFPDIRSRMFTAFRATIISVSSITIAVIIYALYTLQSSGGDQYTTLMLHAVILLCIVIIANTILYRTILERTGTLSMCQYGSDRDNDKK